MTIQSTLLPHKHVRFADSIFGLAGHVRGHLSSPQTVDELWHSVEKNQNGWVGKLNFTHFILSLDLLFAIKQIKLTANGQIQIVNK
jgi:hypothetical protein